MEAQNHVLEVCELPRVYCSLQLTSESPSVRVSCVVCEVGHSAPDDAPLDVLNIIRDDLFMDACPIGSVFPRSRLF